MMALGMLKSWKMWAFVGVLVAVFFVQTTLMKSKYQQGYSAASSELQSAQAVAVKDAVEKAQELWKVASEKAKQTAILEATILERSRLRGLTIQKKVDENVALECRDLGDSIRRVFNLPIEAYNNNGGGVTPDTSAVDDPLQ